MMKGKIKISIVFLALLFLLTGCGKEEIPIEDFVQTNPATAAINNIMKSDTGYYYSAAYGKTLSLHYFDVESGQNIFLCSKPECRHDGDVFCTATSSKYEINSTYFYGGSLYLDVIETTDTEYLYKLLRVSADGSELTELVTYLTLNNDSVVIASQPMMIHRGVAVLPYRLGSIGNADEGVTGTYFYNLVTGELTALPELEYGTKSNGRERFIGYGDYIYFNTQMNRKNTLSRYCLTDGTVEELELLNTYVGIYEVMDEDTVYYYYSGETLFEYKISTKETIPHEEIFLERKTTYYSEDGKLLTDPDLDNPDGIIYGMETIDRYKCQDMMTDGTYLYVAETVDFHNVNMLYPGMVVDAEEMIAGYVHVLDRELTEIAEIPINIKGLVDFYENFSIKILDGTVYLQTFSTVYGCPLSEFLAGEPVFTTIYDHETAINPGLVIQ
ncbi:MAG: hypothetical protein IJ420_01030 [Lachnospiraceae bacterium]|nr:hypothetical protein [Lachnospiraceae bacterium]